MPQSIWESPFIDRKTMSEDIRRRHPGHVPIIVKLDTYSKGDRHLSHYKYLVPHDNDIGSFIRELRRNIVLNSEEGIWLFTSNTLLSPQSLISEVYRKYKSEDGFLYVTLAFENVFG